MKFSAKSQLISIKQKLHYKFSWVTSLNNVVLLKVMLLMIKGSIQSKHLSMHTTQNYVKTDAHIHNFIYYLNNIPLQNHLSVCTECRFQNRKWSVVEYYR